MLPQEDYVQTLGILGGLVTADTKLPKMAVLSTELEKQGGAEKEGSNIPSSMNFFKST